MNRRRFLRGGIVMGGGGLLGVGAWALKPPTTTTTTAPTTTTTVAPTTTTTGVPPMANANLKPITPGTQSLATALAGLPNGGEVEFAGGTYDVSNVVVPAGVTFTRKGSLVTLRVAGGTTGLITGDDFILNPGFEITAADPLALRTRGIQISGKRSQLYGPRFTRFGNQVTAFLTLTDAPYALVYDSPGDVWADWNHLYSPHFEFVYGGLLSFSVANVMVSNLVARGKIGPGGAVRSHMSGSPSGAPVRINGIWTAHCNASAIQFTEDAGILREGGNMISNWTNEPGANSVGTAAYVESDGNLFTGGISLIGGNVGFAWGPNAVGNVVDSVVKRTKQGTVGPPVDTGPVAAQIYTQ